MTKQGDAGRKGRGQSTDVKGEGGDKATRALVIVPVLPNHPRQEDDSGRVRLARSPEARLDEAVGLTRAIDRSKVACIAGSKASLRSL